MLNVALWETVLDENSKKDKLIKKLQQEIDDWHAAALYDVTMEGSKFRVWNNSQLNRCREQFIEEKE